MKLGGLLGFLAGFMFAYQRSSSELTRPYPPKSNYLNSHSAILGLVGKQSRRKDGSRGTSGACSPGIAALRYILSTGMGAAGC